MLRQSKHPMRCYKLLITLSVSLLLWVNAFGCDIVLKKNVVISGDNVEVGDIAYAYPKKLANVVLCAAPYINNSITLSKVYIQSLLSQRGFNYSICGSNFVKVERKGYVLSSDKILSILNVKDGEIVSNGSITLPFGNYSFSYKLKKSDNNLRFYDIYVYKGSHEFRSIPVVVKVNKDSVLAPVASHDISRGSRIKASDIEFVRLKSIPPNAILSKSVIVGRVAISFIKKGSAFTQFNTRRFKPVKMGDIVKVKVVQGNIVIYTVAKALRGGYDGDIIPIMYLSSNKVRPAEIVGNKLVVVQ